MESSPNLNIDTAGMYLAGVSGCWEWGRLPTKERYSRQLDVDVIQTYTEISVVDPFNFDLDPDPDLDPQIRFEENSYCFFQSKI